MRTSLRRFSSFHRHLFQDFVHKSFNQIDSKSQDLDINNLMQQLSAPSIDFQEMMKGIKKFKNKTEAEIKKEVEDKLIKDKLDQQQPIKINLFNSHYLRIC